MIGMFYLYSKKMKKTEYQAFNA
jgi:class 3 adenylate cyclase